MALMPTLTEIYDTARAELADVSIDVYTNAVLAPFVKRAVLKSCRYLRSMGVGLLRKESPDIVVPAATVALTRTGGNVYPTDMIRPIEIRERTPPATTYTAMRCQNGFLPIDGTAAGPTRQIYDWVTDKIVFPAATGTTNLQIQYEAYYDGPADYTIGASTVNIPDSLEAIALMTAGYACFSRDEKENGSRLFGMGMEDLAQIAEAEKGVSTARAARYGGQ